MSKGQRSPSKMVGGAKIRFRTKPHTCQRCSEGSNIPCVHKDPETPQRLRQNCVWVSPEEAWVSSGLLQELWVWHKLSWRKSRLTPPQSHQNLHRTGETDSWRAQTEPCAYQDPGERSSDPQETDPDLTVSVKESLAEAWVSGGLLQGCGH